jgi:hypothetical protein
VHFSQLFKVNSVPSVFVILQSNVVETFDKEITQEEFLARLDAVFEKTASPAPDTPPIRQLDASTIEQTAEPNVVPSTVQQVRRQSTPASASISFDTPASPSPNNQSTRHASTARRPGSASPAASQSVSSQLYQDELKRQRQLEAEERKRILRLVETDREERKARQRQISPETLTTAKKHTRSLSNSNDCALVIRLFDGTALKNLFINSSTLDVVRKWVDENRSDGDDPYSFFQTFPKRTFGEAEERSTLRELGLCPSSTLILKPAQNVTSAYTSVAFSPSAWLTRGSQTLVDAMYTFLGIGYKPAVMDASEPESSVTPEEREHRATVIGRKIDSLSRSTSSLNVRTLDDANDASRVTYNGNQLDLEDDNDRRDNNS